MLTLAQQDSREWAIAYPEFPPDMEALIDQAIDCREQGDVESAEQVLRLVVSECPAHIDAWFYLALLFSEQGQDDEAMTFAREAVALGMAALDSPFEKGEDTLPWEYLENRAFLRSLHFLAQLCERQGDAAEAKALLAELIQLSPDAPVPRQES